MSLTLLLVTVFLSKLDNFKFARNAASAPVLDPKYPIFLMIMTRYWLNI